MAAVCMRLGDASAAITQQMKARTPRMSQPGENVDWIKDFDG
jgi:hypothetical protein